MEYNIKWDKSEGKQLGNEKMCKNETKVYDFISLYANNKNAPLSLVL